MQLKVLATKTVGGAEGAGRGRPPNETHRTRARSKSAGFTSACERSTIVTQTDAQSRLRVFQCRSGVSKPTFNTPGISRQEMVGGSRTGSAIGSMAPAHAAGGEFLMVDR